MKTFLIIGSCVVALSAILFSYQDAIFAYCGVQSDTPQKDHLIMESKDEWKKANTVYEFTVKDIDGNDVSLEKYRGHPLIIMNVASRCGLTQVNYAQMSEMYDKYADSHGLRVLAFPSNQFARQEPGTDQEIKCFVAKYNTKYDMFAKIDVNGDNAHPLWKFLKSKQGGTLGSFIKWNFTKFIVDKEGHPVARYGPSTEPKTIEKDLSKYF